MKEEKVLLAMSGGVDSSVAAFLLKQKGFEVIGVTMRLWEGCLDSQATAVKGSRSRQDLSDAAQVARMLGIEHLVVDFRERFFRRVVEPFVEDYRNGRTPNPCVLCNRHIKVELLSEVAIEAGCKYLATGHYARVVEDGGLFRLLKGVDSKKDQSYFLYRLDQKALSKLLLPNGAYSKEEIVRIARDLRLGVSEKEESQEICFIPHGDYRAFLREFFPQIFKPGLILSTTGEILGKHEGIVGYTVGQRRGLGISHLYPLYVVAIDPERNAVIVGRREEAEGRSFLAEQVCWVRGEPRCAEFDALVRIRYNMKEMPCRVKVVDEDHFYVSLERSLWAITPGQSAVIYQGEDVLGGGIIASQSPVFTGGQSR